MPGPADRSGTSNGQIRVIKQPTLRIYGIRHHGPGSARALLHALRDLRPDKILVEGPADATAQLHWLGHSDLVPPVALIGYRPDQPARAAFFPFAEFSPELQSIRYGLSQGIPVAFMDLPQAVMLAVDAKLAMPEGAALQALAEAAGYPGYEVWWNHLIEQRLDQQDLFPAVQELMTAARGRPEPPDPAALEPGARLAAQREAHMRAMIRTAFAEGCRCVAVVCGAWHGPALEEPARFAAADVELLAHLPSVAVDFAWVPWTYGRLASFVGYGAGVPSPGWYHHLWESMGTVDEVPATADEPAPGIVAWMAAIGALLRAEGFEISTAHVIEALRLAEALTALRGRTLPGLPELDEAARTVMCAGNDQPMQLIRRRLVVGERMGRIPDSAPMTPFQRDLRAQQHQTGLEPRPEKSRLTLDLRTGLHLDRSRLLHRLSLLRIDWGKLVSTRRRARAKGTYAERWDLEWRPELAVPVVEAAVWGNTVVDAATAYTRHLADEADGLVTLTTLLTAVLPADLDALVPYLMQRIEEESILHADLLHLMDALPPLVEVLRFGSVRGINRASVRHAVDSMLTRVALGLPGICRDVSDDAADELLRRVERTHLLVGPLAVPDHTERWSGALATIADDEHVHALLAGRSVRLLFDGGRLDRSDIQRRFHLALGAEPPDAETLWRCGLWLDGFLRGADQLLLRDRELWSTLDRWVLGLTGERFLEILPLLRRAFAGFRPDVRDELLARVRGTAAVDAAQTARPSIDHARAARALPLLHDLLGVPH